MLETNARTIEVLELREKELLEEATSKRLPVMKRERVRESLENMALTIRAHQAIAKTLAPALQETMRTVETLQRHIPTRWAAPLLTESSETTSANPTRPGNPTSRTLR